MHQRRAPIPEEAAGCHRQGSRALLEARKAVAKPRHGGGYPSTSSSRGMGGGGAAGESWQCGGLGVLEFGTYEQVYEQVHHSSATVLSPDQVPEKRNRESRGCTLQLQLPAVSIAYSTGIKAMAANGTLSPSLSVFHSAPRPLITAVFLNSAPIDALSSAVKAVRRLLQKCM